MNTLAAITHCIAGCGTRQTDDDDVPPDWLRPLQPHEQQQPYHQNYSRQHQCFYEPCTQQQQQNHQHQLPKNHHQQDDFMAYLFNTGDRYIPQSYPSLSFAGYTPYDSRAYVYEQDCDNDGQSVANYVTTDPNPGAVHYCDSTTPREIQCNCLLEKPGQTHDCPAAKERKLDDVGATADRIVTLLKSVASRAAVDADEHVHRVRARIRAEMSEDRPPVYKSALNTQWNPQWRQNLAEAVLGRMVEVVRGILPDERIERSEVVERGEDKNGENQKAILAAIADWARRTAPEIFSWMEDHPRLTTCIAFAAAVAVLWVLAPWVLEAAGFGELGPIADSVAARLQMRYMGQVPKGSWFSFFQRLGMVWGK
ncbi:hypothetical protein SEUCBS140593_005016 [Sporothrix eucalyptigena]|uniref:Uncharacterized protein n=1 Tax=Sporothrix eucalyptigena TaxID=1812306 RepID=A0ABP0BSV4_9PEZI